MGRVKLPISRLEENIRRQVIFAKRKLGIIKKAEELGILCDTEILLLIFSPCGKPTLFVGEKCGIENVIEKFCGSPLEERYRRKLENLQALKKTCKKQDHDVNLDDFFIKSPQKNEELLNELGRIKNEFFNIQRKTWYFDEGNENYISNLGQARCVEESLMGALAKVRMHKEALRNGHILTPAEGSENESILREAPRNGQGLIPSEGSEKLYSDNMRSPSAIEGIEQLQPTSWISTNGQICMVHEDPSFGLNQRALPFSQILQPYLNSICSPSAPKCTEQSQLMSWIYNDNQVFMDHEDPTLLFSQRDVNNASDAFLPTPTSMDNCMQANMENTSIPFASFSNPLDRPGLSMHSEYQGSSYYPEYQNTRSVVAEEKRSNPEMSVQGTTMDYDTKIIDTGFDGLPLQWPSSPRD